ncbi:hypothetical protein [Streptomyces sp. NPDC051561]|uniref:hypothetical protein n=1 Tax=Streptomyces sp. NPDC051561 TaxID=3365658 RepID=UPI003795FD2B
MARHAAPKPPRRALLQAGLTVTAVGAALSAGAGAAQAAPAPAPAGVGQTADDAPTPGQALTDAVTHSAAAGLGPAKNMRLNPLAGTDVDPLNNTIGTQVADFKPVSTGVATAPLTSGGALKDLPLAGGLTGIIPG